jgi:hypothetical protein
MVAFAAAIVRFWDRVRFRYREAMADRISVRWRTDARYNRNGDAP